MMNIRVDEDNGKYVGMDGIEKFGGFQSMNFGRTMVVSFQLLHLVLRVKVCGKRNRRKI